MAELKIEASHVQGRIVVLDKNQAPTQATVPFTLKISQGSLRLIIGGENGCDVFVEKYTRRTVFIVHPNEGDPVAMVEVDDNSTNEARTTVTIDKQAAWLAEESL